MEADLPQTPPSVKDTTSPIQETKQQKEPLDFSFLLLVVSLGISIICTVFFGYQFYQNELQLIESKKTASYYKENFEDILSSNGVDITVYEQNLANSTNSGTLDLTPETVTRYDTYLAQSAQENGFSQNSCEQILQDILTSEGVDIEGYKKYLLETKKSPENDNGSNEIDKLISYKLPEGWSKDYRVDTINVPSISLYSSDFKHTVGLNFQTGIYINIWKQKVDSSYNINNENNDINQKYLQDFKITTLAGKPAAYGFLSFQKYSDQYIVLNNLDKWTIFIGYGGNTLQDSLNTKALHKNNIDQFLNSVSFK